jgi:hypothetical protein
VSSDEGSNTDSSSGGNESSGPATLQRSTTVPISVAMPAPLRRAYSAAETSAAADALSEAIASARAALAAAVTAGDTAVAVNAAVAAVAAAAEATARSSSSTAATTTAAQTAQPSSSSSDAPPVAAIAAAATAAPAAAATVAAVTAVAAASTAPYLLRIVYTKGATVRSGVEIDGSAVTGNVPHGTELEATARVMSACGIARFLTAQGWISERLRGGAEEEVVQVLRHTPETPLVYTVVCR